MRQVRISRSVSHILCAATAVGFCAAASWILSVGAAAEDGKFITVRGTGNTMPPPAIAYLAKVAKPRLLELKAGTDIVPIVTSLCGSVNPAYVNVLKEQNPALQSNIVTENMSVAFPACFYSKERKRVTAIRGDGFSSIAERYVGLAGPQTLEDIKQANSAKKGVLQPGDTIILPTVTEGIRYELNPGTTPEAAIAELKRLADVQSDPKGRPTKPLIKASPASDDEQLVSAVEHGVAEGAQPQSGPACGGRDAGWPFDSAQVLESLRTNLTALRRLGFQPRPVTIAIVDTGLDGYDTVAFPRAVFDENLVEFVGAPDEDLDGNDYLHDVYGVNVYDRQAQPVAFADYYDGDHGTHVAGLALGGPTFRQLKAQSDLGELIRLKIINVVRGRELATATGPKPEYSSPAGGLERAVDYAAHQDALIVNMSYIAPVRPSGIETVLKSFPRMMLIAAAGNSKTDLETKPPVYPPAYGGLNGDLKDQVISVAAHDGTYNRATFSNFGRTHVDVAAPGCDVISYGFDGELVHYSGTSFAAPIVSFTAALLVSEQLPTARAIKARIMASVDIRKTLQDSVVSEGSLNVVKAVSVSYDVLEVKDSTGQPLLGWIVGPASLQVCNRKDPIEKAKILKITPNYVDHDGSVKTRFVTLDSERKWRVDICPPLVGDILFRSLNDLAPSSIAWEKVVDVVPAYFPIPYVPNPK